MGLAYLPIRPGVVDWGSIDRHMWHTWSVWVRLPTTIDLTGFYRTTIVFTKEFTLQHHVNLSYTNQTRSFQGPSGPLQQGTV